MLYDSADSAIGYNGIFKSCFQMVDNGLATEELGEPATVDESQRPARPAFSALLLKSRPFKISWILYHDQLRRRHVYHSCSCTYDEIKYTTRLLTNAWSLIKGNLGL